MRRWKDARILLVVAVLLGLAYLLPPDTSWREIRRDGLLRACVPERYPPLVTTDEDMPGIDVEILRNMALRLGLTLQLVRNPAMGRDFNPRNWRVTRAQCEVLAGGIVASATTRSFLEMTPTYLETGWAAVSPVPDATLSHAQVGVLAGSSGLDRIALSGFLRRVGATVRIVEDPSRLEGLLEDGEIDAAVGEALRMRAFASSRGWHVTWLPVSTGRYGIGLGLWKGDLTLKRHLVAALEALRADGTLGRIVRSYHLTPIR